MVIGGKTYVIEQYVVNVPAPHVIRGPPFIFPAGSDSIEFNRR
jgi:hypothetical protein